MQEEAVYMVKKLFSILILFFLFQFNYQEAFSKERKSSDMKNLSREEVCKKNYEDLFKTNWNPNTGSDPEMMNILQKYIFGEVFTIGNLDNKTREMITVTSLSVQQTLPQLKAHINALLNTGATPLEVREIIYQCAPFIGFPKTLNAIEIMNQVFIERGINLPLENSATSTEQNRYELGKNIQMPIYGDEIKKSLESLPDNMGENVSNLLTEVCFGDFYTRKYLDLKTRELLVLAILTTTNNPDTLKSHIRGNLKVGNSKEIIAAAIIQCMPYTGFPNTINALKILQETITENEELNQPFKKGEINPYNKFFTGTTYLNMLVEKDELWNSSIGNVTFEKGSRTNWHSHTGGQILLVTAGEGRYQEKGKPMQILKQGDVVKIPINVIHWHGASPDSAFSHISIETNVPNNKTTWLDQVKDNEYK